jgi:hypothetical protein
MVSIVAGSSAAIPANTVGEYVTMKAACADSGRLETKARQRSSSNRTP